MTKPLTAMCLLYVVGCIAASQGGPDAVELAAEADVVLIGAAAQRPAKAEWGTPGEPIPLLGITSSTYTEWTFTLRVGEVLHGQAPQAKEIHVVAVQPRKTDGPQDPLIELSREYLVFLRRPTSSRPSVWVARACFPCAVRSRLKAIRKQLKQAQNKAAAH